VHSHHHHRSRRIQGPRRRPRLFSTTTTTACQCWACWRCPWGAVSPGNEAVDQPYGGVVVRLSEPKPERDLVAPALPDDSELVRSAERQGGGTVFGCLDQQGLPLDLRRRFGDDGEATRAPGGSESVSRTCGGRRLRRDRRRRLVPDEYTGPVSSPPSVSPL